MQHMAKLGVIVPSNRPNRVGSTVASWVVDTIGEGWDVDLIDLREIALPAFDEPSSPKQGLPRTTSHAQAWADRVQALDALVVVTPEYNGSYPCSLKNAIDYLYAELQDLPSGVVGYGWGGGQGAIDATEAVLTRLKARVESEVALFFRQDLDVEGNLFVTDEKVAALRDLGTRLQNAVAEAKAA
jgi:NAD(P)H-dependent FMN reductase